MKRESTTITLKKGQTEQDLLQLIRSQEVDDRIGQEGRVGVVEQDGEVPVEFLKPLREYTDSWRGISKRVKSDGQQIANWLLALALVAQKPEECQGLTIYAWCPWSGQVMIKVNEVGQVESINLCWMDYLACRKDERVLLMPKVQKERDQHTDRLVSQLLRQVAQSGSKRGRIRVLG